MQPVTSLSIFSTGSGSGTEAWKKINRSRNGWNDEIEKR